MRQAEILAIGNELLLGDVLDTNSHELARVLTRRALRVRRVVQLPDEATTIASEISASLQRATDLLICTGGLGPTDDDLTLQAETFSISGAKIQTAETKESAEGQGILEQRLESVRGLHETVSLLFHAFCEQRIGKNWSGELEQMRHWLKTDASKTKKRSG